MGATVRIVDLGCGTGALTTTLSHAGRRIESRNPEARLWQNWNEAPAERWTAVGRLGESTRITEPDPDGVVIMYCHNDFLDAGGVLDIEQRIQFRTVHQISADLARAGLTPHHVWRDWFRTPFTGGADQPLMIFEASLDVPGTSPEAER